MNAIRRRPACRHDLPALALLYLPKHRHRQKSLKKKKKEKENTEKDYKPINFNPQSSLLSFCRRAVSPTFKIIWLLFSPLYLSAARLGQWDKRWSTERMAVGSNPGRTNTQGFLNN